jgi:hypothetical protein
MTHRRSWKVPDSVKMEHEELHRELRRASKAPGNVGKAARDVAKILHPHFAKEEEYALPPLALLPVLTEGELESGYRAVISMTNKLEEELPQMLREHSQIITALDSLRIAAERSDDSEYVRFAEQLALHAKNEEEILYPAAVLVGKYLKLKFKLKER